jgi:hypothetical protein
MKKLIALGIMALVAAVTLTTWRAGPAMAQTKDCSAVIQFDTTTLQTNYAAQLSVLNTVNQSNYDQKKRDLAASIPGYFGGNYSEFSERRSALQSSFSQTDNTTYSQNLYQRVVSPESARMYQTCMQGERAFIAWVSSTGIADDVVAVTVRNNRPGTGSVTYKVSGATPINQPSSLTSGSEETLYFEHPRNKRFVLVLNARDELANATFTVPPIQLPAYVNYNRVAEYREVSGTGRCGAGCQGNTSGCPIREAVTLAAPADFTLMPDTVRETNRRVAGGPGINIHPTWTWTRAPNNGMPSTMVGTPGACDGASGHTQGIVDYDFAARAVRYSMRLVP